MDSTPKKPAKPSSDDPHQPPRPTVRPLITLFELICAASFLFVGFALLMTSPSLGLANNGDFRRVITNAGLEPHHDLPLENPSAAVKQYVEIYAVVKIDHPDRLNKISRITVLGPVKLAKLCNRMTPSKLFDLRWLSLIYLLIATLAMGLWVRGTRSFPGWQRLLLATAFCYVFLDVGYLVYFGSFYTEAPSLVYLLCALGCLWNLKADAGDHAAENRWSPYVWAIGFFGFCTLFSASKAQNVPLVFPLLLAGLATIFWTRRRILWGTAIALAMIAAAFAVQSVRQYDISLRQQNSINTVFNGLLVHSPDPAGDLKTLGLRPEWAAYANQSQFAPRSPLRDPAFEKEFFPHITPARIALFYATHPSRLLAPLADASASLFDLRIKYLGNFLFTDNVAAKNVWTLDSAAPLPAKQKWKWPLLHVFTTWSNAKATLLPGKTWFWIAGGLAAVIVGLLRARCAGALRSRSAGAALIGLGLIFLLVPPTCIAGDGIWEIQKHLFLGAVAFDLILLLLLETLLSLTRPRVARQNESTPAILP